MEAPCNDYVVEAQPAIDDVPWRYFPFVVLLNLSSFGYQTGSRITTLRILTAEYMREMNTIAFYLIKSGDRAIF